MRFESEASVAVSVSVGGGGGGGGGEALGTHQLVEGATIAEEEEEEEEEEARRAQGQLEAMGAAIEARRERCGGLARAVLGASGVVWRCAGRLEASLSQLELEAAASGARSHQAAVSALLERCRQHSRSVAGAGAAGVTPSTWQPVELLAALTHQLEALHHFVYTECGVPADARAQVDVSHSIHNERVSMDDGDLSD
jgi:hypothetical protein